MLGLLSASLGSELGILACVQLLSFLNFNCIGVPVQVERLSSLSLSFSGVCMCVFSPSPSLQTVWLTYQLISSVLKQEKTYAAGSVLPPTWVQLRLNIWLRALVQHSQCGAARVSKRKMTRRLQRSNHCKPLIWLQTLVRHMPWIETLVRGLPCRQLKGWNEQK